MAKNPGVILLADVQSQYPLVWKVVDAKTSRKIEFAIDSRDCEIGTPESPRTCAAAIAVARHTGLYAMVRRWVTILIDPKTWIAYRYLNDPDLAHEIETFRQKCGQRTWGGIPTR